METLPIPKQSVFSKILWHIPMFLLGMITAGVFYAYGLKGLSDEVRWARDHQKETKWAIQRYDTIQKAAMELYYQK